MRMSRPGSRRDERVGQPWGSDRSAGRRAGTARRLRRPAEGRHPSHRAPGAARGDLALPPPHEERGGGSRGSRKDDAGEHPDRHERRISHHRRTDDLHHRENDAGDESSRDAFAHQTTIHTCHDVLPGASGAFTMWTQGCERLRASTVAFGAGQGALSTARVPPRFVNGASDRMPVARRFHRAPRARPSMRDAHDRSPRASARRCDRRAPR